MTYAGMRHPFRSPRAALPVLLLLLAAEAGAARAVQDADGDSAVKVGQKAIPEAGLVRVPAASTPGPWSGPGNRFEGAASTSSWWLAPAGVAALLTACVIVCLGARKQWARGSTTSLKIVGRTILSPRHSIVLVQAGRRTLMIGLGPQSAPSLLGEFDADDASGAAADRYGHRPSPSDVLADDPDDASVPTHRPVLDLRLGGEE